MEPRKYDFVEVTLEPEDYEKVKEVYRLHKEQANKIFNLASGITTDEDIMECIRDNIRDNIVLLVSDAMEAVIGAIYLDGGFANAKEFVLKYILTDVEHKQLFYDSKTILQEVVQGEHETISYVLLSEKGPDHDKTFEVAVMIGDRQFATGQGHTKKAAEQ